MRDRTYQDFGLLTGPANESKAPHIYRFTIMLYCLNSSPFMLAMTLEYHLRKYKNRYPKTCQFLNSIYVEDIVRGHENAEREYRTSLECKEADITLHKWQTNTKDL
ncbi:reverse transcriptase domain-containing protein [Caerostris darwini]|uniref:Reverse transcriptase domain-containing protein n=1 Tax=Caerostris darwini TaxID=1538125 RepID=A0AAV4QQ63_9ARAC|nr:reverse transcriptase domain-containing protein [Caerostris darwini]